MLLITLLIVVAACRPEATQVNLPVAEDAVWGSSCILTHEVLDVVADTKSGAPANASTGAVLVWPKGMTARRSGTETVVLDPTGRTVMTTGGRYWVCPSEYLDSTTPWTGWVIGMTRPCPDCKPGQGAD